MGCGNIGTRAVTLARGAKVGERYVDDIDEGVHLHRYSVQAGRREPATSSTRIFCKTEVVMV